VEIFTTRPADLFLGLNMHLINFPVLFDNIKTLWWSSTRSRILVRSFVQTWPEVRPQSV